MAKVVLVHPTSKTHGYSFITPRWLYVIAAATPARVVGNPIVIDEMLEPFDPAAVDRGDIVGIGINSGNCLDGYRVLRQAKSRGATVIFGGIHTTLVPEEPLEMGADAVVTGNGDAVWRRVVADASSNGLQQAYEGGRLPGDELLPARWDLFDPRRYMLTSVQTVLGCPENCSFCSVWVTDGRKPRIRPTEKIIREVEELYNLGFRFIVFADDNFAPATRGRIAREPSRHKKRELERIREERLRFFEEFGRAVPPHVFTLTQLTSEIASDEEYLSSIYENMKVRLAWIGVESFSEEGLASANKAWNPAGNRMIDAIQRIQDHGIVVVSSIICGLETDTKESIRAMRRFAKASGTAVAQFTIYSPFPGSKDYFEMLRSKRRIRLVDEKYWLSGRDPVYAIEHPALNSEELLQESRRSWKEFYKLRETINRMRKGYLHSWPTAAKMTYVLGSAAFKRIYGRRGFSADSAQKREMGLLTRLLIKAGLAIYNHHYPREKVSLRISLADRS
jgi:radical SAM superfamily enzyme YgiQ (UPF0313 family)